MVADAEINSVSGFSVKILVNGKPPTLEGFSLFICDALEKCGLQRTQWQGWIFKDSVILIFVLLSPTPTEAYMFAVLDKKLFDSSGHSWFAEGVIPLSAPGTLRYLTEIIP